MLVLVSGKAVAVAVAVAVRAAVAVELAQLEIKSSEMLLPHHLPLPLILSPPHHHHHHHHHHHPHLLPHPVHIRLHGCYKALPHFLNVSARPAPAHPALEICQTLPMKTTMTMTMTMRMRECISFMKGSRNALFRLKLLSHCCTVSI